MKPADDPRVDYRALVRDGYDACADAFGAARAREDAPELELLLPRLAKASRVLDLGCGAGVPVAAVLTYARPRLQCAEERRPEAHPLLFARKWL